MFKVGDYVLVNKTINIPWVTEDVYIIREIDDEKIVAQYGKNGVKVTALIEDCEEITPTDVYDITVLFENGVEKIIPWICNDDIDSGDKNMYVVDSFNGSNYGYNKSKVVFAEVSSTYKAWKDKHGQVKRVAD